MTNTMESREFVIRVRRPWTLWILPTIALLYFIAVVVLAILNLIPRARDEQLLVLGGVALFGLVFLVQIPFLLRRRTRRATPEAAAQEGEPWAPQDDAPPAEPTIGGAPATTPLARDDEYVTTAETQKGLRVLEYSQPAKSANKGAVYAKTYVPVTKEFVLRVENVAAERHEL